MIIVLMGVSGCGKTTIGQQLAVVLRWNFSDADDFHSAANVENMKSGIPLTDADREPWLASLRAAIERWERTETGHVVACSALKRHYRDVLAGNDGNIKFVYLHGDFDLIYQRLNARSSHFFDPVLLRTQFDALEEPDGALTVDIATDPNEIVEAILTALQLTPDRNMTNTVSRASDLRGDTTLT